MPHRIKFPLPLGFAWVFLPLILSPELGCKTSRSYFQICPFFFFFPMRKSKIPLKDKANQTRWSLPASSGGPTRFCFVFSAVILAQRRSCFVFVFCLPARSSRSQSWGGDCWEVTMSGLFRMTVPGEQGWGHMSRVLSCPEPEDLDTRSVSVLWWGFLYRSTDPVF